MNTKLYLSKLGLQVQKPSLNYLNEIITAHQKKISFNNLAVFYNPGKILNLELGPLFEKVVLRNEGGYCFENNKMLFYLLRSLGFQVEAKSARVIYDKTGDVPRTHRTTVVTIDGDRFLADVGFGKDVPPSAVPIGCEQASGHQVIEKEGFYFHQLLKGHTVINLYSFDDGHYQESDFTLANYYTNTHPDSKFVKELIISRKEKNLIEFINGRTYTIIENQVRKDITIKDQAEFEFYLKKFGITKTYNLPDEVAH